MHVRQVTVSAVIPVFNGEGFIAEAIASIRRQTADGVEIIVVDDGSTDSTRHAVAKLGNDIRYTYQENRGPPAARRTGLTIARGRAIAFLDADDLWSDDKLNVQLPLLNRKPGVEIVLGHTQHLLPTSGGGSGRPRYEPAGRAWPTLSFGAALIRRSAFERVGLPNSSFTFDDDVDWFLRAKEAGLRILFHPEVTLFYRRHDANITNDRGTDQRFFLKALKRSLDRRREAPRAAARPLESWFEDPKESE